MASKLNEGKIMQALNWAYDKALDGTIPGTNSSYEMAENYLKGEGDLTKRSIPSLDGKIQNLPLPDLCPDLEVLLPTCINSSKYRDSDVCPD